MDYKLLFQVFDHSLKYQCPICNNIGLIAHHDDDNKNVPWLICQSCGYHWTYKRYRKDERMWKRAWSENGSINLRYLSLEEKCITYERVKRSYDKKKYYILSDDQIKNRDVKNRVFTQHGLKHVKRNMMIHVNCSNGKSLEYNYETNTIIKIAGDDGYISFVEKGKERLILVSEYLSKVDDNVSFPVRHSFVGLIPDLFFSVYSADGVCVLKDITGNIYQISVN